MALAKRPISTKSCGPVQEWTSMQVSEWLKDVNGGLFSQYAPKCQSNEIDGATLIEMTSDDMQSKLGITIPNHTTTLTAAIGRLKKKAIRHSADSDKLKSGSPSSPSLDDIPSVHHHSKRGSAMLPSYAMPNKNKNGKHQRSRNSDSNITLHSVPKQKTNLKGGSGATSKSLNYTQMYEEEEMEFGDFYEDDAKANGGSHENTEALKKELTEQSTNKKHLHKDIGKKLVMTCLLSVH